MTRNEAKNKIVERITSIQGCKGPELPSNITDFINKLPCELTDLLEELVQEGRLCEVEYVLAGMPDRIKSFYLPPQTEIRVKH